MKISIRQPLSYSHIGKKDKQEDCIYPPAGKATPENRFFILCDGMGGHEDGEVASNTVCETLGRFFEEHQPETGFFTDELFQEGLAEAYDALDRKDTGAVRKMGTTLTFIYFHNRGCVAAHMGDSRIYQVRPGIGVLYQSSDHSLVNDLIKIGELSPDEAQHYPQKNVITRAMQPHQERRSRAEIHRLSEIQAGDYFFLCCDGVLEQLTNEILYSILSDKSLTDEEKMQAIEAVGKDVTRDNYTAYLIPIDLVIPDELDRKGPNDGLIMATMEAESNQEASPDSQTEKPVEAIVNNSTEKVSKEPDLSKRKSGRSIGWGWVVLAVILLAGLAWLSIHYNWFGSPLEPYLDKLFHNSSKPTLK